MAKILLFIIVSLLSFKLYNLGFLCFKEVRFPIITAIDLFVGPLVFIFLILLSFAIYKKKYSNVAYGKLYIYAIIAKLLGTLLMSLLYQYFFKGGDTFNYFNGAQTMYEMIFNNFEIAKEFYFKNVEDFSYYARKLGNAETRGFHPWDAETMIYKIGGWLSLITFNSYLGISFLITYFSFLGSWRLFQVFTDMYPKLYKQFALGTLFVPSILLYGGGLMKDPIVLGCLGYFTYDIYHLVIKKKFLPMSLVRLPINLFLMVIVKAYIIAMFLPPLVLWIVVNKLNKIKSPVLRRMSLPLFITISLGGALLISNFIGGQISSRYKLENIIDSSVKISNWISYKTEKSDGSGYSLGKIEPTLTGMLKKIPAALNVTFFRPYIWDVKGPAYYPIVLESLFTLLFTLYVLIRVGLFRIYTQMFKHPEILFCLVFALLFGFFVGFISSNFGALVRYKMPCLPFYYAALIILLTHSKRELKIKRAPAI